MDYTHHYSSPLGGLTIASDGEFITGLWFDGQQRFAATLDAEHEARELPVFEQVDRWLDIYFRAEAPDFTPPTRVRQSAFCQRVCQTLLEIPYGETRTYGDIARQLAAEWGIAKMSAQAVGGAVGRNPIGIIIPCHRVVGANGNLTGYGGGLENKIALLRHEGNDMTKYSMPRRRGGPKIGAS